MKPNLPRLLITEALDNAAFDEDCLSETPYPQIVLPGIPEFGRFMLELGLLCDGMGEDIAEHALKMADTTLTVTEPGRITFFWPDLTLTDESYSEAGPVR